MYKKIDITELHNQFNQFKNVKIKTPDGWQRVGSTIKKQKKQIYRVLFSNGDILEISADHLFQKPNEEWIYTKNLNIGESILSKDGAVTVIELEKIDIRDTYDLEVLHKNHRYYTNSIISHNTGKTFVALWSVISLLLNHPEKYHKIVLMKPYVEAGEKLGFLPGNVKEKMDPYIISYYWCLDQIIGKELYQQLMFKKQIEVMPMGLIRGITFQNCLIILDEAQNTSPEQMKTFITRLGEDSKMIILGDEKQSDVKQNVSGLTDIREKLFGLDNVSVVVFDNKDVVRHSLIKTILDRYDDCEWLEQKSKFGT